MDSIVKLAAPAKLNLRLRLLGRREDGYHLLSMLNVLLDLQDCVHIEELPYPQLSIVELSSDAAKLDSQFLNPANNLASRAWLHFTECFDIKIGARLYLHKRIPLGAGLAGGSSDAAAVLKYLMRRFGAEIRQKLCISADEFRARCMQLAVTLGSDLPFFFSSGFAYVSGRGEQVTSLDCRLLEGFPCLLLTPPFSISSQLIYDSLRQRYPRIDNSSDLKLEAFIDSLKNDKSLSLENLWPELCSLLHNDLEEAIIFNFPQMGTYLKRLREDPQLQSHITGSGSAIFSLPSSLNSDPYKLLEEKLLQYERLAWAFRLCRMRLFDF